MQSDSNSSMIPSSSKQTTIVFFDNSTSDTVPPHAMLLGLPLLQRSLLSASRAGANRIVLLTSDQKKVGPFLAKTSAVAASAVEPFPIHPGRLILLSGQILPSPQWLQALSQRPLDENVLYLIGDGGAVLDATYPATVLPPSDSSLGILHFLSTLGQNRRVVSLPDDEKGRFVLASPQDISQAEDWLLKGLVKTTESFMSRHVERPISLAISRRLAWTGVTPNMMSVVSLAIGLLSAPFFLTPQIGSQFIGGLLFLAHSILDGCDGELARLKFQESRWGGLLDIWGDNLVHIAIFLCMAIGWSEAIHAKWPLLVGASAIAGTLGSAWFVYRHTMQKPVGSGPLFTSVVRSTHSPVAQAMDTLGRRDFIWLVLLLSAFGKVSWFLLLTAVGSPIFFLVLLWLARQDASKSPRNVYE